MAGWAGFSEEELHRLKKDIKANDNPIKKASLTSQARNQRKEKDKKINVNNNNNDNSVPVNERLSNAEINYNAKPTGLTICSEDKNDYAKVIEPSENNSKKDMDKNTEELPEEIAIAREVNAIEQFQLKQKIIEEQNKKKKKMLSDALINRQQRTKKEVIKLQKIKDQLNQLDQLISVDVSIIRDKIEEASREYVDAQRRYDKAEKEFIAAKIDVNHKQEVKDDLVEHLYTIIHQNELRKAKKLTELMEILEMEDDDNVLQSSNNIPGTTLLLEHSIARLPPLAKKQPETESDTNTSVPIKSKVNEEQSFINNSPSINSSLENSKTNKDNNNIVNDST